MTANLETLYGLSFAIMLALTLMARNNRKTGWVKHRNTAMQDLLSLELAWEDADERAAAIATSAATASTSANGPVEIASPEENAAFTGQLARLCSALRISGKTVTPGASVHHVNAGGAR